MCGVVVGVCMGCHGEVELECEMKMGFTQLCIFMKINRTGFL